MDDIEDEEDDIEEDEDEDDGDGEDEDEEEDEGDGEDEEEEDDIEEEDVEDIQEEVLTKNDQQMKKNIKNANLRKSKEEELAIDYDYEDRDSVSDYYEDLKKFEQDVKEDYIAQQHPELKQYGFEEIQSLTTVIRDKDGFIVDPLHTTVPFVTRYERARVIGMRAKQIHNGSKPYVEVPDHIIDGIQIAEMEFLAKKLPFIIKRPIYGGKNEYWKLKDLEILET
jgi:DNA-directed RNA polymerase subunit K/omega